MPPVVASSAAGVAAENNGQNAEVLAAQTTVDEVCPQPLLITFGQLIAAALHCCLTDVNSAT